jgi:alkylated DNA repair dioxygenase AlkB
VQSCGLSALLGLFENRKKSETGIMMSSLVQARLQHHVDNDYCGDYVAGVTLLSPRVMEFRRKEQPTGSADGNTGNQSGDGVVRMLVEPRSFYVMRYTPIDRKCAAD